MFGSKLQAVGAKTGRRPVCQRFPANDAFDVAWGSADGRRFGNGVAGTAGGADDLGYFHADTLLPGARRFIDPGHIGKPGRGIKVPADALVGRGCQRFWLTDSMMRRFDDSVIAPDQLSSITL
jgi:hypothetical protein